MGKYPQSLQEISQLPQLLQVSTHLPLHVLLLPAPPRTQAPSRAQVKTAQTLPKHNFLLPARVFLEEGGEEKQPTRDLSQACLMQKQEVLK